MVKGSSGNDRRLGEIKTREWEARVTGTMVLLLARSSLGEGTKEERMGAGEGTQERDWMEDWSLEYHSADTSSPPSAAAFCLQGPGVPQFPLGVQEMPPITSSPLFFLSQPGTRETGAPETPHWSKGDL